jgi:hypothetical protein
LKNVKNSDYPELDPLLFLEYFRSGQKWIQGEINFMNEIAVIFAFFPGKVNSEFKICVILEQNTMYSICTRTTLNGFLDNYYSEKLANKVKLLDFKKKNMELMMVESCPI